MARTDRGIAIVVLPARGLPLNPSQLPTMYLYSTQLNIHDTQLSEGDWLFDAHERHNQPAFADDYYHYKQLQF